VEFAVKRFVIGAFLAAGWAFWIASVWAFGLATGFGHKHEVIAVMTVVATVPLLLLAIRHLALTRVRTRTMIAAAALGIVTWCLVFIAALMEWIGVASQE
jgi:hypothetical protein